MIESLQSVLRVYLVRRDTQLAVLAPGAGGIPEPLSTSYPILKVAYISSIGAVDDASIRSGANELQSRYPTLMLMFPSPDGAPYRSGFLLCHLRDAPQLPWTDGRKTHRSDAVEYAVVVTLSMYSWGSDLAMGRPGYFLSGGADADHMWRIARVEADFAGRQIFSLVPLRLATGLPRADFSSIEDEMLRGKLVQHWEEVQACLRGHLHGSLITAAKNLAETLTTYALKSNPKASRSFASGLTELKAMLDRGDRPTLPFSDLDLHLMNKVRILHARTHPDRVVREARVIDPALALTAAPDIAEVLVSIGLACGL